MKVSAYYSRKEQSPTEPDTADERDAALLAHAARYSNN